MDFCLPFATASASTVLSSTAPGVFDGPGASRIAFSVPRLFGLDSTGWNVDVADVMEAIPSPAATAAVTSASVSEDPATDDTPMIFEASRSPDSLSNVGADVLPNVSVALVSRLSAS